MLRAYVGAHEVVPDGWPHHFPGFLKVYPDASGGDYLKYISDRSYASWEIWVQYVKKRHKRRNQFATRYSNITFAPETVHRVVFT